MFNKSDASERQLRNGSRIQTSVRFVRANAALIAVVLLVSTSAVGAAGIVALTPSHELPIGTATTAGDSMVHDSPQFLLYVDAEPEVGDSIVFYQDTYIEGEENWHQYVNHRVVGVTDDGRYLTKGDGNEFVDQDHADGLGFDPVHQSDVRGVVLLSVGVPTLIGVLAALLAALGSLAALRYRESITSAVSGFSESKSRAVIFAVLVVASLVAMPFMAGVAPDPDHDGTASASHEWDYTGESNDLSSDIGALKGMYQDPDTGDWYMPNNHGSEPGEVVVFDSNWNYKTTHSIDSEVSQAGDLWQDPDSGHWYVINRDTGDTILEYDSNWNYQASHSVASHVNSANSIHYDPETGHYWIADGGNQNVTRWNKNWNLQEEVSLWSTTGPGPMAMYKDSNGDWWVADGDAVVHRWDSNWNKQGDTYDLSSEASRMYGIFVSQDGNWWTNDGGSSTVYKYGSHSDGISYSEPVTGQVTDKNGDPIEGAAVGADDPEVDSTTTNSTGHYELAVPEAGTYDVTADDGDYVSTKSVDVTDGGISGVDFALGPANPDGQSVGLFEDEYGIFPADSTSLVVYERSTEYKSVEEGMSVRTWHEDTWTETETGTFNWENRTRVDLVDGRYYRLELESNNGNWEDSGFLYNESEMADSTIWLEPDPSSTDTNGDGTTGASGSSGTNARDSDSTGTPTSDEDGNLPTATEQQGFGPTALGTCETLDGQDGVEVEYWDPDYTTHELEGNLTVDGSTTYHIRKSFDSARGYYRGCIADSMTDNASDEREALGFNHTALDEAGNEITTGSTSWTAPAFGPTGNAPSSTGERLGLLAGVLGALGVLWVGGNKVVPASSVRSWPSETINPAFGIGAPIVTVLGLDLAGGGVISAGVATGLAQVAPFAGIVGVSVVGYAALRWIRAPPST